MKEKNNWEEISGDISNVAKRIKSKIAAYLNIRTNYIFSKCFFISLR